VSDVSEKLAATGKWSENTAWLSERAGHKCEYCGLDLFASVANYRSIEIDHIIPKSKGGAADDNENLAISCRTCNVGLKSRWNPATVCNSKDRNKLIEATRQYIKDREQHYLKEIQIMKNIVNGSTHNE